MIYIFIERVEDKIFLTCIICFFFLHGKNNFVKRLIIDIYLKIILLNQNNFVGISCMIRIDTKNFDIMTSLSNLCSYFDGPLKLFSDLCVSS